MKDSNGRDYRSIQMSGVGMLRILIVGLMLVSMAGWAQDTRLVETGGNDDGNCISSACATIQYAIDQSSPDDSINIGTGSFPGNVTIDRSLTLQGSGIGDTTIVGRINIESENVTVRDFEVADVGHGFMVPLDAEASGFFLQNVRASNVNFGMEVRAHSGSEFNGGGFDDIHIENFHVLDAERKGLYIERLSNAVLTGIHVEGVVGDETAWNNGLDLNLKDGAYSNILIEDSTFEGVVEGDPDPAAMSAAIAIKARHDGVYADNPASLTGLTLDNVVIRGSFNGLRFGEPGVDYDSLGSSISGVSVQGLVFEEIEGFKLQDLVEQIDIDAFIASSDMDGSVIIRDNGTPLPEIYSSIQDAIYDATAHQTVEVHPGTYVEALHIPTDGLTLVSSDGAEQTVIDADGADNGIEIGDHSHPGNHPTDVVVEGFTVAGWVERGISQRNGDGTVHILDNIALNESGGSRNGINISGGTGSTVIGNIVETASFDQDDWSGTGILLMGSVNGLVEGNTITGADLGVVVSAHPGWSGLDPTWEEASGNVVRNNTIHGVDGGVSIQGNAAGTEVDGNDISDSFWGVTLSSSTMDGYPADTAITNNEISDTDIALYFGDTGSYDAGYVDVEGNVFEGNQTLVYDLGNLVDLPELVQANQINPATRLVDIETGADTGDCIATACETIQYAIGQADEFDIVDIAAGTYPEQLVINKSLTISGGPDVIVEAPASLEAFEIPENDSVWRPIVLVHGGSETDGEISGAGIVLVDLIDIDIDGRDHLVPSGSRYVGIFYRNASGVIADNVVGNMYVAFDGEPARETMGILAYGDSDVIISDNEVSGYARGGIGIQGSEGFPKPYGTVTGNTVIGPGTGADVFWGPNGIQVLNGAGGEVIGNTVEGNSHPSADPGGVVVIGSDGVLVRDNVLVGNDAGVQVYEASDSEVSGNSISGGTYGIDVGYGVSDLLIDDNEISDQAYDGILVWTTTDPISNVVITNNSIDDADWGITIWDDAVDISDITIVDNLMGDNNQQLVDVFGGVVDEQAFVENNQFAITIDLDIMPGVDPLDPGSGWAGFTAHLASGGEVPENILLWIEVAGIGTHEVDQLDFDLQWYNPDSGSGDNWTSFGWGGFGGGDFPDMSREAYFLGRDGSTLVGFEIPAGHDESIPLRVNWPNGIYTVTASIESFEDGADNNPGDRVYLNQTESLVVESDPAVLALEISDGVDPAIESPGFAHFTATLTNSGGDVPENVLLWSQIDSIDNSNVQDFIFQYFDGTSWIDYGWGGFGSGDFEEMDREAYFIGRDGSTLVGIPIPANYSESIPIRMDFPNGTYQFTTSVESFVDGDLNDPGERTYLNQVDTLDVVSVPDELAVALADFETEYQQGDMETGSEQVVFTYTENAGDIKQVFNVFRVFEAGTTDEVDYAAMFESVGFDPNQIRGLSGTDADVITPPAELGSAGDGIVSVDFLLSDTAPLGDFDVVIASYDVTGIDPGDVSLDNTDTYRVLDSASHAVSLIQGPDLQLTIDGPTLPPLAEQQFYSVRLENAGDAATDEDVSIGFAILRPDISLDDVVVDWCADSGANTPEACTDWQPLTLSEDNGSLSGSFGPSSFPIAEDYDETTFIRAEFLEPGNYEALVDVTGAVSEETLATAAVSITVSQFSFEIEAGVDGAIPDPDAGSGWAYYTATLINLGDELPENILQWVGINSIGDDEISDGATMQWYNLATESWTDFAWGDHPDLDPALQREAFFLGRDGSGNVSGFPVGDGEVFETPIRVNFDNATYAFTTSVESMDGERLYAEFSDEFAVVSQDVVLDFDIERGVTAPDQPPRWDYFTATLSNTDGGAAPDNIVLYVAVDETDFVAGDALEFWNGTDWQHFGWDADREAWFLGRDGAGGVSGFPIDADEVFEIEIRVNYLPDVYTGTISVESFDDSIVGVGGVYGEFVETVEVLPTSADITFDAGDLFQVFDGTEKTVGVTTSPEAGLDVEIVFDPAPPIDAGNYTVIATVVDPYFEGEFIETLVIEPAEVQVILDDLVQVYDGNPRQVTVSTDPQGVGMAVTYDGSNDAPVNAGSYLVVAEVVDPNYEAVSESAVFTIEKGNATVTLSGLVQTYDDGNPLPVTVETVPAGLDVVVTYDGNSDAPGESGSYSVFASVEDSNWAGSASGLLMIEPAAADITLDDLEQTYDGTSREVTAITDPAGLAVQITYDGQSQAPINAGSYEVVATVDDANHVGSVTAMLDVAQAEVDEIQISDLEQAYDGDPKPVSVSTVPGGLEVSITYDGNATPPTDAGNYQVQVEVVDTNYFGTEAATLVVEQGSQTIDFPALPDRSVDDSPFAVSASASSGLDVAFSVLSGPATIDGNTVTLTGDLGEVVIEATQGGNANWQSADAVQQSFEVTEGDGRTIESASATTISGQAGEAVEEADLPTVRVLDEYDNPVSGVTVGFEVTSGSGSVTGATQVTGSDGRARVGGWMLGSEASQVVSASAPGIAGSPVEFIAEVDSVVELDISVTDNRDTIEPGERNTYVIVVSNAGPNDAEGVEVQAGVPGQKVPESADWVCFPGADASCTESGSGDIQDDVNLAAGSSVTYVFEADVADDASGTIEFLAVATFGDETVSGSTTTQIIITEDSIFGDRFEEVGETDEAQGQYKAHIEGHLEVTSDYRGALPPRQLLVARDDGGDVVFRVRTLRAEGLVRTRIEVTDSHGDRVRSAWMPLDPADEGIIGFDYDAELGLLIVAGQSLQTDVQARGEGHLVESLSTDQPDKVTITLH